MFLSKLFHRDKPIPLYEVTEGAFKYYTTRVKGNKALDLQTVKKKLTRDIECGEFVSGEGKFNTYAYGNLLIGVSKKNNKITWIENHYWKENYYIIDEKKRNKLNMKLGLN